MDSPITPPQEATDIFSLSDQVLSDRLEFVQEIGYGNWGSVWLCHPKHVPASSPPSSPDAWVPERKIAVKLVHRSRTSTTAARVRSLWNEMKIVRSFKSDPHPSIIPFHSFIITPSYALITMTYLPTLVPVEVDESKAREWFRFLLSGVEFLHKRGVVHNDIKPANILVSSKNIPVLVDFGFAEKYDLESDTAFHSNLSYGTPEYLSPERARGLPHDTRKSDVWSLGVTFFEILIGRTPFENSDGEQFTSKDDLERYWARTLRGKWIGAWKMSAGMEKLLRRMIAPNADLRCTATQAIADSYWHARKETDATHRRSSSYNSSIVFEKDMAKLLNLTPSSRKGKENFDTPPGLEKLNARRDRDESSLPRPALSKSKSQPKVAASKIQPRKRVPVPPIADLSPIKASPPSSPLSSASAKENIASFNALATKVTHNNHTASSRRPFGAVPGHSNLPKPRLAAKPSKDEVSKNRRKNKALGDVTGANRNSENVRAKGKDSSNVKDRVREWEREKQRLREMERLEEMEKERDERATTEGEQEDEEASDEEPVLVEVEEGEEEKKNTNTNTNMNAKVDPLKNWDADKEDVNIAARSAPFLPLPALTPPLTQVVLGVMPSDTPVRATKESNRNTFKHSIKKSIDKTMQFYKSSTFGQVTARSARSLSIDIKNEMLSPRSNNERQPWEEESSGEAISPLPIIRNAEQSERMAADARTDRLTIWMRNVEKVVEDARQNFALAAPQDEAPLPSLPVPPLSRNGSHTRSNHSSRLPRKILAASQIFSDENLKTLAADQSMVSNATSACATANTTVGDRRHSANYAVVSEGPSLLVVPEIHTPSRQRRATVSAGTPEAANVFDADSGSPSKRKEKSKSHGNLFQQRIARLSLIEAELNKAPTPEPSPTSPRLSEVMDRNLFIASPVMSQERLFCDTRSINNITPNLSLDDLTSSPCHVEPYPPRKPNAGMPLPDTPSQRRLEGVYDRFLMATSGVKRNGKGYQSDNAGPVGNSASLGLSSGPTRKNQSHRAFYSGRRPMPPPVSSEDQRRTVSVDELGVMHAAGSLESPVVSKDDSSSTVSMVRRAIKAMVPGKTASRRLSRMA